MSKLTLLVGPPGSGKSTLAKKYAGAGFVYVNQDSQGKQHLAVFEEALREGRDIVVDRLNFSKAQRDRYLEPAKAKRYETAIIVLHQPYKVCLERMLKREGHETINNEDSARSALGMFFSKYERVQDSEADTVARHWPDGDKPLAVICDLDGTLCDIRHRLHHVRRTDGKKKDWKSFFEDLDKDTIHTWCVTVLRGAVQDGAKVVFCSGRPDNHKKQTKKWLEDHDFIYEPLYMRPRGDSREDSVIKEIILDFELLTRYTPYFFIDDRKRVVDMWRARGFVCLHCAEGDF
ncbi:MAG: AAA family ATPase [Candidatus Methanoperedens sp.]|nr:AAA family ATPase [Candidatus Methanoperedens sp.]